MTTEEKAKLCNIYYKSIGEYTEFSKKSFNKLFPIYNIREEYKTTLFDFGCFCFEQTVKYEQLLPIFNAQDNIFNFSVDSFKLLRCLLINKNRSIDITFYTIDSKEESKHNTQLNDFLLNTIYSTLVDKMRELGNLEISIDVAWELVHEDFNKAWLNDWNESYKEKTKNLGLYSEILYKPTICRDYIKYIESGELSIMYIDNMLAIANCNKMRILGDKNKFVNSYDGTNISSDVKQLNNSLTIVLLTLFLRFDSFLENKDYDSIRDVPLSNQQCRFIYDFLNFFNIYFYTKVNEENQNRTTTKESSIRAKYKGFFNRNTYIEPITRIHRLIDEINCTVNLMR